VIGEELVGCAIAGATDAIAFDNGVAVSFTATGCKVTCPAERGGVILPTEGVELQLAPRRQIAQINSMDFFILFLASIFY
jgi:hypothetical protein